MRSGFCVWCQPTLCPSRASNIHQPNLFTAVLPLNGLPLHLSMVGTEVLSVGRGSLNDPWRGDLALTFQKIGWNLAWLGEKGGEMPCPRGSHQALWEDDKVPCRSKRKSGLTEGPRKMYGTRLVGEVGADFCGVASAGQNGGRLGASKKSWREIGA